MKKSTKQYLLLALVVAVVMAFAYMTMTPDRLRQKVDSDIVKVNARFNPVSSVDLGFATKMVTHDAPQMLNPPEQVAPLLLFPPSAEDLAKLSGE